jgi:hypothetical protein
MLFRCSCSFDSSEQDFVPMFLWPQFISKIFVLMFALPQFPRTTHLSDVLLISVGEEDILFRFSCGLSSLRVFPPMFLYIQFNMTMQCSAVLVIVSIYQYAMLFRCSRRLNPPIRYSCPMFLLWFKFLDVALSNHQFRFNVPILFCIDACSSQF